MTSALFHLPAIGQLNADFTPDKAAGCSPFIVHYSSRTTGASGNATYQWDLGNGNSSTISSPVAIYTDVATYTVTLTVRDGTQTSSATHTISVYQAPQVDFSASPTPACIGSPVNFISSASAGSGSVSTYLWDFGDGSIQQGNANVSHSYQASGDASVSLTVTNSFGCTSGLTKTNLVNTVPGITPAFSMDKKVLCTVTDPVQFTNSSTGSGIATYVWDFGDGSSSTQVSPSHSYAQKGTYTIKLTATSSFGCSVTDSQVNSLNVANYTADFKLPAAVCQGTVDSFIDNSKPVPDSRNWQVDGSNAGSSDTLLFAFTSGGSHTIAFNALFGSCPQTVTKPFTAFPKPVIAFDTTVVTGCDSYVVHFTDRTPGAVAWAWIFNYDPYEVAPPIDHSGPSTSTTYPYFANRNLFLAVTDGNGCKDTITKLLNYLIPHIVFIQETDALPESSCGTPMTKSFTIQNPQGLQSYTWHFGDGTSSTDLSPTHTFSGAGEYGTTLTWTDDNGCTGTTNGITTIISPHMQLDFTATDSVICANTQVYFASPSLTAANPIFVGWQFGDGSASSFYSSHTYTTPGTYTVTLYADNVGCDTTVIKQNYMTVLPAVGSYIGHTNTCDGNRMDVTFDFSPGSATNLLWDFGDGNTTTTDGSVSQLVHTYTKAGDYMTSVTGGNTTCKVQNTDEVVVFPKQSPLLTADQTAICTNSPLAVNISNYDLNSWTGLIANSYTIQFQYGDSTPFLGNVSSLYQEWSNAFSGTLSNFQASENGLRVITTSLHFGCNDTSNFVPLAIRGIRAGYQATVNDPCFHSPVSFQDTSRVSVGNSIVSWLWDFGDGQTSSSGGTVSHTFAQPGNYPVKLTVTDASGCSSSSSSAVSSVDLNGLLASFTPSGTNVPLNTTVLFTNSSNTYGGSDVIWTWDFGDGSGSAANSPSHTYTQPGTYIVKLTGSEASGSCSSSATATIVVKDFTYSFHQTASYLATGTCPPLMVQFTNTSSNYTHLTWDFGDGDSAVDIATPSHVYTQPGTYIITLSVFGDNGLVGQDVDSVKVIQPSATLSAVATAFCAGQDGQLKASADSAVSYAWDFGDGQVASTTSPAVTHPYAAGNYDVKLVVTDAAGCAVAASADQHLQVHAPPKISISPAQPIVCLNSSLTLMASGGSTYSWSPADGLDDPGIATPNASPRVNTVYNLTISDDIGCMNTDSVSVQVIQPFSMSVTPDSTAFCPGQSVTIKASGAARYTWIDDTRGLSDVNAFDPVAKPLSSVVYTVTGSDAHACFTDTSKVIITVLPLPVVDAGQDQVVLAGNSVQLLASGSADIVTWNWSPAQFLSCTDCAQPVCTPNLSETYIATVKNASGCTASDTVVVKLECDEARVRIPDAFTPNGDGHNDRFVILGISEVDHLVIYDRWGNRVFERNHFLSADPSACWDGTFRGLPVPTGIYVYYVEIRCPVGGLLSLRGTVVLVR